MPTWAAWLHRANRYLSTDLFGGPRVLKLAWVINAQKLGSLPFVTFLMWWYGEWSGVAWVYLALYGSCGICWVLKDIAFPDANWRRRVTWGGGAAAFLFGLAPYWVLPWLLLSGRGQPPTRRRPSPCASGRALLPMGCSATFVTRTTWER